LLEGHYIGEIFGYQFVRISELNPDRMLGKYDRFIIKSELLYPWKNPFHRNNL
jgi:hypothetical protein